MGEETGFVEAYVGHDKGDGDVKGKRLAERREKMVVELAVIRP